MTRLFLESALRRPRHLAAFLVLGDPDPERSFAAALAALDAGATMLELGIPYRDPVADGPAVRRAQERALAAGTTTDVALELVARLRRETDAPFHLLLYANLVHARGAARFLAEARAAGASSVLLPEVPLEEDAALARAVREQGLAYVRLAAPASDEERLRRLGDGADLIYLAGRQGVTGARDRLGRDTLALVRRAARTLSVPLAVGFGLARADHVRDVLDAGARIAVVGSALALAVERAADEGKDPAAAVADLVSDLARGLAAEKGDATC